MTEGTIDNRELAQRMEQMDARLTLVAGKVDVIYNALLGDLDGGGLAQRIRSNEDHIRELQAIQRAQHDRLAELEKLRERFYGAVALAAATGSILGGALFQLFN